jgi:hypothetical protein
MFRGATICTAEIDELRSIERVTRSARLRHVGSSRIVLDNGELPSEPDTLFIDCTAAGLRAAPLRPVFEPDRITLQLVTIGFLPWSAATIGAVEASRTNDAEKNALCPPLTFSGNIADVLDLAHTGSAGIMARSADPELARWTEECRLNPARGATARAGSDPQVASALTSIITNLGPAMNNLADLTRLTGRVPRQAPDDAPLAAP